MAQAPEQNLDDLHELPFAHAPQHTPEVPKVLTVAGQELTVFVEWPALRDSLMRDIRSARRRIWVETYIFFNDAGGKLIANALKEKARHGVDVRVMYDAVGSLGVPAAFFNEMIAAGVKVHCFHRLAEALLSRSGLLTILNRRNHRKLIVIDDAAGYFGGMNIVDNTMADNARVARDKLPTSAGWRDVHVRLAGDRVRELAESFEHSWRRAHNELFLRRRRKYRRAPLPSSADPAESIRFFDSGPIYKFSRVGRIYSRLLRSARHTVYISMAYFIPVGFPQRALLSARKRGVRVRIIVPEKSDVKLVKWASAYLYDKMIRRGFRIYERQSRMLHSKMIVVDDQWTAVGSANFDPRSFYINREFVAVIRSQRFAAIMKDICLYEMHRSHHITQRECLAVPWYKRLGHTLAWSLRWWL